MTVQLDAGRCIGCGMCAAVAPEVFFITGGVSAVWGEPDRGRESRVYDAANGCPVNAITVKR